MKRGHKLKSPVSGITYEIGEVLGEGGFGTAYQAWELTRRGRRGDPVCLKTTPDQASWHRESYFGEILRKSKRAIQTLDSFPIFPKRGKRILYCLVLELAERGTLSDYLEATDFAPWKPARAKREILALLKMLDGLHGAAATHRDITPMNVFVCGKRATLKLGDFGIARHDVAGSPMTIDAFNPAFVTKGISSSTHRYWMATDDVYQMGQLLGVLLTGSDEEALTAARAKKLDVDPHLRAVVVKAIGPRTKRYADAFEMIQALEGNELSRGADLDSLAGKTVVFTGPLSIKRFDAEVLVLQAGGKVAKRVTQAVDVVVQGGRSANYKSGHTGTKLAAARKLIAKGKTIHIIGEAQLRRLTRP